MKSLVRFTALVLSLVSTTAAFAHDEVDATPVTARLQTLNLDPQLTSAKFIGGSITIDTAQDKATLTLDPAMPPCPIGRLCAAVMPPSQVIELPLISVEQGTCNSRIYTAVRNRLPVDGLLETLSITDDSLNYCLGIVPTAPVAITYTTLSPGFGAPVVETRSTFTSGPLQPFM